MSRHSRLFEEINQSCSPLSILIITKRGELKRIFCPFQVRVIMDVGELKKDQIKLVSAVKINHELILVYLIDGLGYFYYWFAILDCA